MVTGSVPEAPSGPPTPLETAAALVQMTHTQSKATTADGEACGPETFEPTAVRRDDAPDLVYCANCKRVVWRQGETADLLD